MDALPSLLACDTVRPPISASPTASRAAVGEASVIVRTILARALQAEWLAPQEGLAVMRWLDRLDARISMS
jgi:hypothetical protein